MQSLLESCELFLMYKQDTSRLSATPYSVLRRIVSDVFLNFRSMGILLPPISQVTTAKPTSHHRNRSLDSVLQRIPEIDVTPSPECETAPSFPDSYDAKAAANKEDIASLGSDDSGIICR